MKLIASKEKIMNINNERFGGVVTQQLDGWMHRALPNVQFVTIISNQQILKKCITLKSVNKSNFFPTTTLHSSQ